MTSTYVLERSGAFIIFLKEAEAMYHWLVLYPD